MPVSQPIRLACLAFVLSAACSAAWAAQGAQAGHAAAKPKPVAADNGFGHVEDWFSYGRTEAEVERAAPGVRIKAHDPHEDDIIVYGVKQRRDFEGASRDANLTSPQGLDAAQPVVPGIGDSCSYKSGCFDSSQPTLRSTLFGD
jgi:hypothetical protein